MINKLKKTENLYLYLFFVNFVLLTNKTNLETIVKEIKALIDKSQSFLIVTHTNPDGDALGSALGLYDILLQMGRKNVNVVTPNGWPDFLDWMPYKDVIINAEANMDRAEGLFKEAELIFCVDFNGASRISTLENALLKAEGKKVLIDHHPQPQDHFDILYSKIQASSTSEMIFEFARQLNLVHLISQKGAECLYTGIMTDTGSFSYSCNQAVTYQIVAQLIDKGINAEAIHKLVYDNNTESRLRLLGFCLSEKLRVFNSKGVAYISLSLEELERFQFREGDTEGVVNYALSIQNIDFAAMFIEQADQVRISFRSKGKRNVNDFSRTFFNGGGHKNAAGGKSFRPFKETIEYFESLVSEHIFFNDVNKVVQ